MTMKLPELPVARIRSGLTVSTKMGDMCLFRSTEVKKGDEVYTQSQLDAAVNEALERAAKECESDMHEDVVDHCEDYFNMAIERCAAAIRRLKGEE